MLLKIFIVMGVTYFFEFIGFILTWIYGEHVVWKYFVFNNIVNALQGFLIFAVLICKRPILRRLSSQWSYFKTISLSEKISFKKNSSASQNFDRTSIGFKLDSNHSTDVIFLCGIAGKYSTSSAISISSATTDVLPT